jgi:serine/threonine protein kinase
MKRGEGGTRDFCKLNSGSSAGSNNRRAGCDTNALAPMIIVSSDDGNRGAVLPYETVAAATGNWAPSRRIGSGGSATVYRAEVARYGTVAVKRFLPENGSGRDWTREVEALCQCRHPNILEIIGHADDGPENLIVMPLMEGGTLTEAMHKMWWASRVTVVGHIIHALSFLHGKGMVHRDVKSSNILLDISLRRARLADFGLAKDQVKRPGAQTCHGTTGVVVGSPGYLAPELMMRPATEKTDAYAMGVVFLEILTGLPAWDSDENGAILTERAVKDGTFQESLIDKNGSWPASEIAACVAQAIPLTLFDPSQRRTVAAVEQEPDYVQHLERAAKADEDRA